MNPELWTILLGGAVGAISAYVAATVKFRNDVRAAHDKAMRDYRIQEYKSLWRMTEMLPKYARKNNVTYQNLDELSVTLRDWYFQCGGMFLSDTSRDAYFSLQTTIHNVLKSAPPAAGVELKGPDYELVREQCSNLRTALTKDVGTRWKPLAEV